MGVAISVALLLKTPSIVVFSEMANPEMANILPIYRLFTESTWI